MNGKWLDFLVKVRLPIILFVVAISFATAYFVSNPERHGVGYAPEQPIPFSHKKHAGEMKIDCTYCHFSVDKSRHAGIPTPETCMNCHSVAKGDSPHIKNLKNYFENSIPIPWKRVHKVPDFVYFNHSAHVNKGIQCQSCHGPVEQMEKVEQVRPFTMQNCLQCHKSAHGELEGEIEKNKLDQLSIGPNNCSACHR
jgi:hypothetical protein